MGLLVINTVFPLTPRKRAELKAIAGDFIERRPEELYVQAREITSEFGENSDETNQRMDDVLNRCGISDEDWQNDILVLCCCWNTAGIEMANIAILNAAERRKGAPICEMVFGSGLLCDRQPRTWNYQAVGLGGSIREVMGEVA